MKFDQLSCQKINLLCETSFRTLWIFDSDNAVVLVRSNPWWLLMNIILNDLKKEEKNDQLMIQNCKKKRFQAKKMTQNIFNLESLP